VIMDFGVIMDFSGDPGAGSVQRGILSG